LRALSVRAARCYSFCCESERRNAGAIFRGDYVAGFSACVRLFGDLRELFGCGGRCGDGEAGVRARDGGGCCWRRAAASAYETCLLRASPFRF
jgi:hypothetical protein